MTAPLAPRLALLFATATSLLRADAAEAAGEYFFGEDPGLGSATPLPLASPPPALVDLSTLTLPPPASSAGAEITLGLRFREADGDWGPTSLHQIHLVKSSATPLVETAWGAGLASPATATPAPNGSFTITRPVSQAPGDAAPDLLSLRLVATGEQAGPRLFRTVLPISSRTPERLYYSLDQRVDPAVSPWLALDESHRLAPAALALNLGSAAPGFHTLHLRVVDATGVASDSLRFVHLTESGLNTISGLAYAFRDASNNLSTVSVASISPTDSPQDLTLAVPASLSSGESTLLLHLVDSGPDLGFISETGFTVATHFEQWAATALAGLPAEQRSLLADPDGDRLVNLLEFAFGTDPQSAQATPPYRVESELNAGAPLITVRYPQREGGTGQRGSGYTVAGLRYTVEVSSGLQTWQPYTEVAGLSAEVSAESLGNGWETVQVKLSPGATLATTRRFFARLTVSVAP